MRTTTLNGCHINADGTRDTFWGVTVPCDIDPPRNPIPSPGWTPYRVLFNGRWRRVKRAPSGVCYIGQKPGAVGEQIRVDCLP